MIEQIPGPVRIKRVRIFAFALVCVAAATLAAILKSAPAVGDLWIVATLALVAAFAERSTVFIGRDTEQSISLVPTLFAAGVLLNISQQAGVGGDTAIRQHGDTATQNELLRSRLTSSPRPRVVASPRLG